MIATDATYPVCEFVPSAGASMAGFEPDIWNAIGTQLGVQITPVNTSFDGLIPGVQSGRYPAAMECISDNPAREKVVTFVDFIYGQGSVYALRSNAASKHITSNPLSLCGLTAAAQTGTDFANYLNGILTQHCLKHGKPPIHVSLLPSGSQVELAVLAGRVDIALDDTASVAYLLTRSPKPLVMIPNALIPRAYLGIVVPPGDNQLRDALLAAVHKVVADGTYATILAKWKIANLALTSPGVNLATVRPIVNPGP